MSRRGALAGLLTMGAALVTRPAHALATLARSGPRAAPWDDRFELAVTVEVITPSGGRRPYVVVYVETPDEKPVRTIGMWIQRGRRSWIRELRRWFRMERDRQRAGGAGDISDAISSPTRRPGTYTLVWDGRTDAGEPAEMGTYFVCVECVRERGSYQIIRQELTFAGTPFAVDLEGNQEIGGARVEYRERE
ncbi:MAG: DUF2271 domain-containing protein [Gemmatimonadota bacterium]